MHVVFFPNYVINGTLFGKHLLKIKYVLIFGTILVSDISHYNKKKIQRDIVINVSRSSRKMGYSCQILKKRKLSRQNFEQSSSEFV
jgi:hypothetical protein